MRFRCAFLLGLVLVGGAWGQPPAPTPERPARASRPSPCDDCVPGVTNFARVSGALWRGGQPTAEGFRNLERLGVRTIVSFRHDHDDLPLLKGTKLHYLRIPSRAYRPEEKNLVRFLKLMQDSPKAPVFVHCAQGRDRTGYNVAAYRMVFQEWSAEEAILEMKTFRFNRVWIGNPGFLRSLDVEKLQRRVAERPVPTTVPPAP